MSITTMKQALEALRTLHDENMDYLTRNKLGGENNQCMVFARETITALRQSIEQAEQYNATSDHCLMENAQGDLERVKLVQTGVGIGKPEQEPVAWMNKHGACVSAVFKEVDATAGEYTTPLYTAPPQRQPEPVIDSETVSLEVAIEVVLRNKPTFETIAGLCKMAVEADRLAQQAEQEKQREKSRSIAQMDTDKLLEIAKECGATTLRKINLGVIQFYTHELHKFAEKIQSSPLCAPPPRQPEPVIDKSAAIRIATVLGWTPPRQWVGLTDEEIKTIEETTTCAGNESWLRNLTKNIEAKLKEKNT
jgi:hypothetical protein